MPKIPIKPIIENAKAAAPKAKDFIKENPNLISGIVEAAKIGKDFMDNKENRFNKKLKNGKVHYRKRQYLKYHNEKLPNLDLYSYIQLNSFKQEVNSFIKQINREVTERSVTNKPLHAKRINSWKQILVQIEDKIQNRNYEEFLKAYNSSSYESDYFDNKIIDNMRSIESKNDLFKYVQLYTGKDMADIERDFF